MKKSISKMLRQLPWRKICAGGMVLATLMCGQVKTEAAPERLFLELNQSYHLYPDSDEQTIIRVAVTNPAIADVRVIDNTSLNIVGLKEGSTSLTVWLSDDTMEDYNVTVSPQDTGLATVIKEVMDVPGVKIEKIGDRVLLRGAVENQYQKNQAQKVAEMFADQEHVINLLKMTKPLQINLAALVIDISSNDAKDLGFQYGNSKVDSSSGSTATVSDITFGTIGKFYGGQTYHSVSGKVGMPVDVMLQALVTSGKAEILSRPNITTLSGETADILIGGEIPVPTSNEGDISITWREYGIKLHIEPTSDDAENIMAKVNAEISTLDYAHEIKTSAGTVPALTSRKAGTSVSLQSGTVLAIGGLLNSEDAKTISKVPLLGDIPIIGQFFRHTSTSKERREMLILLVPSIVGENDTVRTSVKMAEAINKNKQNEEAMQRVDLNAPPSYNSQAKKGR